MPKKTPLHLIINNQEELEKLEDAFDLPFNVSALKTFKSLMEKLLITNDLIKIQFSNTILPSSFRKNPYLFARHLCQGTEYKAGISKLKGKLKGYLLLNYGEDIPPTTFMGRVSKHFTRWETSKKSLYIPYGEIPEGYQGDKIHQLIYQLRNRHKIHVKLLKLPLTLCLQPIQPPPPKKKSPSSQKETISYSF